MVIIKTQNRRPINTQKISPQNQETQIKILTFSGLAKSGSEQPGPGDTLLGWPKSIYFRRILWYGLLRCGWRHAADLKL